MSENTKTAAPGLTLGTLWHAPRKVDRVQRTPSIAFLPCELTAPKPLNPQYAQASDGFSAHLRKRRLDLGLLHKEVAHRLGVDETTIHNWETGKAEPALRFIPKKLAISQAQLSKYERGQNVPTVEILLKLKAFSGRSIDWIVTGEG